MLSIDVKLAYNINLSMPQEQTNLKQYLNRQFFPTRLSLFYSNIWALNANAMLRV